MQILNTSVVIFQGPQSRLRWSWATFIRFSYCDRFNNYKYNMDTDGIIFNKLFRERLLEALIHGQENITY